MSEALPELALARGDLDRAAHLSTDAAFLAQAWADPRSRVLHVHHGRALLTPDDPPRLDLRPPDPSRAVDGVALLGLDGAGVAYLAVDDPEAERTGGSLRDVGALLGDRDAGLLVHAVALQNWHATHQHCPRCGARTDVLTGGHVRRCPVDGSEHYPRTDPAVIMLVVDGDDERCLLGRHARWGERRFSTLAGFVEPGESLEQAVAREVLEETGVRVTGARYLGSQPWPFPASLMLGFVARALPDQRVHVDGEEIIEAEWFARATLEAAVRSGDLLLPPPVSIARRLIEHWYGRPLPPAAA